MLMGSIFASKPVLGGGLSFYDVHLSLLKPFFCSNFIFFLTHIFPFLIKKNYKTNSYFRLVCKKMNVLKA